MAEDAQVYRDLMRFKPEDLTPNAWAVQAGVSRTVWADMRRHGNPSRRTLEKLLSVVGSSVAEFEALRVGDEAQKRPSGAVRLTERLTSWAAAQLPTLPLVACSLAGEWESSGTGIGLIDIRIDQIVDRLPRPVSLANDAEAYAITALAKSMWPRFRPGRRLAVSPRAAVAVGDDVLVWLEQRSEGTSLALMGELVGRTNHSVELIQFAPAQSFSIEEAKVKSIARIVGELI